MVGKLEKSLYSTRDAARNWSEAQTKVLIAMGYKKGLSSPCSSYHEKWDLSTVVHGDDFLSEGLAESLMQMSLTLEQNFQVVTMVTGPDPGQQREARVLNRLIRWAEAGIIWEPGPRHADILIEQMGLKGGRSMKMPGAKEEKKSDRALREDIDQIIDENIYPHEYNIIKDNGPRVEASIRKEST